MAIGVRTSVKKNRTSIAGSEISARGDVPDMADGGAAKKARRHDCDRGPRSESGEGGIEARNPDAEIGDANLVLERARRPADGGRRLFRNEHMASESPEALHPEGKIKM